MPLCVMPKLKLAVVLAWAAVPPHIGRVGRLGASSGWSLAAAIGHAGMRLRFRYSFGNRRYFGCSGSWMARHYVVFSWPPFLSVSALGHKIFSGPCCRDGSVSVVAPRGRSIVVGGRGIGRLRFRLRYRVGRRRRADNLDAKFAAGVLEWDRSSGRTGKLITFSVAIRESIFQNPFAGLPVVRAQDSVDHHRLACQEGLLQRPVEFAVSAVGFLLPSLSPVVQSCAINVNQRGSALEGLTAADRVANLLLHIVGQFGSSARLAGLQGFAVGRCASEGACPYS